MQVDAGVFLAAVKSDAGLACWGSNTFGQATPPAGVRGGDLRVVTIDRAGRIKATTRSNVSPH